MINFLKNTYYRFFTYKQEYENNSKNFCEYANNRINIFKRLSIICHLVYLAFTVYAVIKIIECARNHAGADLYFVELIVFSLMGITAILTKREKLLMILVLTALACALGQYEHFNYFLQYMALTFCTGFAFYGCQLYSSLKYYLQLNAENKQTA
ncbi:MAG: hypothetical protein HFI34_08960 [Lachnospiraceae bacterium]|nr:hypothetical protein [Lachnospiraceae bacterium]